MRWFAPQREMRAILNDVQRGAVMNAPIGLVVVFGLVVVCGFGALVALAVLVIDWVYGRMIE